MTILVPVFRRNPVTLEQMANLGTYEFEQLPAAGDFFNITHQNGRLGKYRVIGTAHEPNREGAPLKPDHYRAFVYVEFLREE